MALLIDLSPAKNPRRDSLRVNRKQLPDDHLNFAMLQVQIQVCNTLLYSMLPSTSLYCLVGGWLTSFLKPSRVANIT